MVLLALMVPVDPEYLVHRLDLADPVDPMVLMVLVLLKYL